MRREWRELQCAAYGRPVLQLNFLWEKFEASINSSLYNVQITNTLQRRHSFVTFSPLFQARGGSGEYVWGSSDTTTATVNFHGQITTNGPGRTNVTAADAKNAAHTGTLSVLECFFKKSVYC